MRMRIIHIYFKTVVLSGGIGRAGKQGEGEEEWEVRFWMYLNRLPKYKKQKWQNVNSNSVMLLVVLFCIFNIFNNSKILLKE